MKTAKKPKPNSSRSHKRPGFRHAPPTLTFLRDEVPRNWRNYCDSVTDNFRIISPKRFRV